MPYTVSKKSTTVIALLALCAGTASASAVNRKDKCDPSKWQGDHIDNPMLDTPDCVVGKCADDNWLDGCEACMCFNNGNEYWCDGRQSDFYDKYFDQHGKSPYGLTKRENRKCNPNFIKEGEKCLSTSMHYDWECEAHTKCDTSGSGSVPTCQKVQLSQFKEMNIGVMDDMVIIMINIMKCTIKVHMEF